MTVRKGAARRVEAKTQTDCRELMVSDVVTKEEDVVGSEEDWTNTIVTSGPIIPGEGEDKKIIKPTSVTRHFKVY